MKKRFFIAVDLGGTNLKIALLDSKYKILARENLSTQEFRKKELLIEATVGSIKGFVAGNNLSKKDVAGVGVGLPGPIDINKGVVHFFPNIPGWKNVALGGILRKKLGLPVYLDNDANLMCLAESRIGSAKLARNAVCVTLGTGVGGGIIIEGKLYRGKGFAAGEIGHMPLNEFGPKCNCGGLACLEAYIGNRSILKQAKKTLGKSVTLEELSFLAKKNHHSAVNVWSGVGEKLGIALSSVVNLLNPDCIVIGGGVANAGSALFNKVIATIHKRAMSVQAKQVKIFKAKLGRDAGLIGAAILVKEKGRS